MSSKKAYLDVTIGVEVDVDTVRREVKILLGSEYTDNISDEECLEVWANSEFSQGLGCSVSVTINED